MVTVVFDGAERFFDSDFTGRLGVASFRTPDGFDFCVPFIFFRASLQNGHNRLETL
jgi:hypothetical protein